MSYVVGQVPVNAGSTVPVLTLPPGLASVTVYASTSATLYLGTSNAVSPSRGAQVSIVPTPFNQYVTSSGATLYAANNSGANGTFFYSLTTGQ